MDANIDSTVPETSLSSITAEQSSKESQELKNLSSNSTGMAESCNSTAPSNGVDSNIGAGKDADNKGSLHDSTCISTNKVHCIMKEDISTASQQSETGDISQPSKVSFQTNGHPISEPTIDENKDDFWPSTAVGTTSANKEKQIEISEQPSGTPSELNKANIVEEIEMAAHPSTPQYAVVSNVPQASLDDKKERVKSESGSQSLNLVDIVALKMKFTHSEFREQNKSKVKDIVSAINKTYSSSPCLSPSGEETNPCKKSPVLQKATSSPVLPIIKITEADDVEEETRLAKDMNPVERDNEADDQVMKETTDVSTILESSERSIEIETTRELRSSETIRSIAEVVERFQKTELENSETIKKTEAVKRIEKLGKLQRSETIRRNTETVNLIETIRKQKILETTKRDTEVVKDVENTPKLESSQPDQSSQKAAKSSGIEEQNFKVSDLTRENKTSENTDEQVAFFYKSPSEIPQEFSYQTPDTSPEVESCKKMDGLGCLRSSRCFHRGIVAFCIVFGLIGFYVYQLAQDGEILEVYKYIGLFFSAIASVIGGLSILYISYQLCFPNASSSSHQKVDAEVATLKNETLYNEFNDTLLESATDLATTAKASESQPRDVSPDDILNNTQKVKTEATEILQNSSDVMSNQSGIKAEVAMLPSESERSTISKKDD